MAISKKISLLGDFSVGKTSLIRRYVLGKFSPDYQATLGVNIYRYVDEAEGPDGRTHRVQQIIWDIESSEPATEPFDTYLRGSAGAIIVADLTRPDMLHSANKQARRFMDLMPGRPVVFALNKVDLLDQPADEEPLRNLREEYGAEVLTTSAAMGTGVVELFRALSRSILERRI